MKEEVVNEASNKAADVHIPVPEGADEETVEAVTGLYTDGVIARKGAFSREWAIQLHEDIDIAYQEALDSIARYKMFLDAIQIRSFENIFEDDTIKITVTGEVQGKLNWLKPVYHIKEREIDVPKTGLRLLAGAEIGNTTLLSDFRYKLNVGLQNKNGAIYRLGYAKEGLQDYIWIGYDISILNLKW